MNDRSSACRLAAVGVAVILLDLEFNRFDVLNDVVGVALVVAAVHRVAASSTIDDRQQRLQSLWWALLVVTAVEEVVRWLGSPDTSSTAVTAAESAPETLLSITGAVLTLLALLALVDRFSRLATGDVALTRSWATSRRLLLVLFAPLTGLLVLADAVDLALRVGDTQAPTGLDLQIEGGAALLLLPFVLLFLVPPAHVAISLWRTARDTRIPAPAHTEP